MKKTSYRVVYQSLILLVLTSQSFYSLAQIQNPIHWSYAAKRLDKNEAMVFLKVNIEKGWHTYSINQALCGPIKTSFTFTPSGDYSLEGEAIEPVPTVKFEKAFGIDVSYFENEVIFKQKVKLKRRLTTISGKVNFMVCNDHQCLPPDEVTFNIPVN